MTDSQPAARGTALALGSRLPNLIIAGVTKAGTTSLFRYLSQHPAICASDEKELRHFLPLRYGEPVGPLATYADHFSHCAQEPYAMEASPGYFYGGAAVARAIDEALDAPRVVIVLREPGERCYSFYNFMRSRAKLPQDADFDSWLDRCEQLHRAGVDQRPEHHDYSGLGAGCYSDWLQPWLDTFGDRLKVLFFDDLSADPAATVADLCAWLGIDPEVAAGFEYRVENKTRQFRHERLQKAALSWNRANVLFFERHQTLKRLLRTIYYTVNRAPAGPRPSPAARRRLTAFYAPYRERLVAQLGPERLEGAPAWLLKG